MNRAEFDRLPTHAPGVCPNCGTRDQHPEPGCGCPPNPNGYGTQHIFKNHHTCRRLGKDLQVEQVPLDTDFRGQ